MTQNNQNIVGFFQKHKDGYNEFIPYNFPFDINSIMDDKLNEKLYKAQHLVSKLSGITELLPDVTFFIYSYKLKDAESSAQIEGTKATMSDVFESKITKTEIKDSNDIDFYIKALDYGLEKLNNPLPLSLRFIKEIHKELMSGARSTHHSYPGEFKRSVNWFGGTTPQNSIFVPPTPDNLDKALKDFENFLHNKSVNPILHIALTHAQFETIHPFTDGNGRVGRLIIIFLLIDREILTNPVLYLSTYFKRHQKIYYQKLAGYQQDGKIYEWLDFFVDGVIDTAENAIQKTKEITDLREKDMRVMQGFGKANADKGVKILQYLFSSPFITSNEIVKLFNYTKPGAFRILEKLQKEGILKLFRKGTGSNSSVYMYEEYLKILRK